jgi:hypothetical protein
VNTTTQAEKERALGFELMRLMQLSRDESVNDLLSAALAGREQTVASVTKLFHFVLRNFGATTGFTPSSVTRKFKEASGAFFKQAGLTQQQLEKIYHPYPVDGDPDFVSVIDEMKEQGF